MDPFENMKNIIQVKNIIPEKKFYIPNESYKMLRNTYFNDIQFRGNVSSGVKRRNIVNKNKMMIMKNNINMRKHHRIQQPGFDVQRWGHK